MCCWKRDDFLKKSSLEICEELWITSCCKVESKQEGFSLTCPPCLEERNVVVFRLSSTRSRLTVISNLRPEDCSLVWLRLSL